MRDQEPQQDGVDSVSPTMKYSACGKPVKTMSLKKLDDPASKDFWDFVQKSAQDWRQQQPDWSRELERERRANADGHREQQARDSQTKRRVG